MQPRAFPHVAATAATLAFASLVACDGGGFPIDAGRGDAPTATGTFALSWTLADPSSAPLTCAQVGANDVSVTLSGLDGVLGFAEDFGCSNSPSTSPALPIGDYNAQISLNGQQLQSVSGGTQRLTISENQSAQLSPVTFVVNPDGNLALSLVPPAPLTTNCGPAPGGAAITGETLELDGPSGCVPVTFVRTRGGTTIGSYTVNCTAPAVGTCIESDETLTVSNLAAGSYQIHVNGMVGANSCFTNGDLVPVPAQGQTVTRTLNLAATKNAGC
jgi:hypothetical protein